MESANQTMASKAERLQLSVLELKKKPAEFEEQCSSIKSQLKAMFDDLRLKLLSKEKELEQQTNEMLETTNQDLSIITDQLENRIHIINNNMEVISSEGNEDIPNRTLNFYSINYPTINQLIEIESQDSFPASEYLKNFKLEIDPSINSELIRKSQQISDEIYSLKHPLLKSSSDQYIVRKQLIS